MALKKICSVGTTNAAKRNQRSPYDLELDKIAVYAQDLHTIASNHIHGKSLTAGNDQLSQSKRTDDDFLLSRSLKCENANANHKSRWRVLHTVTSLTARRIALTTSLSLACTQNSEPKLAVFAHTDLKAASIRHRAATKTTKAKTNVKMQHSLQKCKRSF
jgi:hypothetical protein